MASAGCSKSQEIGREDGGGALQEADLILQLLSIPVISAGRMPGLPPPKAMFWAPGGGPGGGPREGPEGVPPGLGGGEGSSV